MAGVTNGFDWTGLRGGDGEREELGLLSTIEGVFPVVPERLPLAGVGVCLIGCGELERFPLDVLATFSRITAASGDAGRLRGLTRDTSAFSAGGCRFLTADTFGAGGGFFVVVFFFLALFNTTTGIEVFLAGLLTRTFFFAGFDFGTFVLTFSSPSAFCTFES